MGALVLPIKWAIEAFHVLEVVVTCLQLLEAAESPKSNVHNHSHFLTVFVSFMFLGPYETYVLQCLVHPWPTLQSRLFLLVLVLVQCCSLSYWLCLIIPPLIFIRVRAASSPISCYAHVLEDYFFPNLLSWPRWEVKERLLPVQVWVWAKKKVTWVVTPLFHAKLLFP